MKKLSLYALIACILSCANMAYAKTMVEHITDKSSPETTLDTFKSVVTVHAEPQMNLGTLKKLGSGQSDISITSLYEMGFIKGNIFEGASNDHEFTVFFPMTVDSTPTSGVLKLRYKTSALTGTSPKLRVDINDHTVYSTPLSLEATTSGFDIPISQEDMKVGHVKLTIKASMLPIESRCYDERLYALDYVQILPETRLELAGIYEKKNSLRGTWSVLPKDVSISIPGKLTPELMKVIVQAASHIRVAGKTVEFVNLPKIGNIIIAEREELLKLISTTPGLEKDALSPESNIAVIGRDAQNLPPLIVLTEAAAERDLQLISHDWRKVSLQGQYIDQTPASTDPRVHRRFTLAEMGMNVEPHMVIRTAEWKFFSGIPQVPGDMRIKSLHLNVIAPPSRDRMNERVLLFVYVNNILQEVQPLENSGKTQSFTFTIANYSQWVGRNYIKIIAQRFAPKDCLNSLASYDIQITPDSTIEYEKFKIRPRIFNDLHPYFTQGFDLYVDEKYFTTEHLILLTTALSDQKYDLTNLKIITLDESKPFKPTRPFMIYGRPKFTLDDMTVRFDRGPIEVQTDDKRVLLAVNKLEGISIAQVVEHNGVGGLWLAPAEDGTGSRVKEYFLEQGDTSFADPSGEVLNMKTRQMNRAEIAYPEFLDFFTKLGRYRFWIVAFGWAIIGLGLTMIYRSVIRNQKK